MATPPFDPRGKRILLVNDDGIRAPGLKALERIAKELSDDIWVVAPETEQSGAGHSLTLQGTIRAVKTGRRRYAVSGSPTDCVLMAISELMKEIPPDLVLSGVNRGCNIAEDVTYSGTVAAAMEAALLGFPAIALSQEVPYGRRARWNVAKRFAPGVIRRVLSISWKRDVFINVNFPDCPEEEVSGTVAVKQGRRSSGYEILRVPDPREKGYYLIGTPQCGKTASRGDADHKAVARGDIAVTPLHVDLTHAGSLGDFKSLFR
ncbi:MAG: 5'/3'-nucleotidase SurE [Rhodospirillaceae bacterium]|nr:5'/3'-nucleotidase SurE [Rhodospirillaceae bacterium]